MFSLSKAAILCGAAYFITSIATAMPSVIGFDDLTFSQPVRRGDSKALADGYHGFRWSGGWGANSWVVSIDSDNYFSESFGRGGPVTVSGHNYAWSNAGQDLTISRASLFDVASLWVRQGYDTRNVNQSPQEFAVTLRGLRGDVEVFSKEFMVGTSYKLLSVNFSAIDQVVIENGLANLLVDDITVDSVDLPEPSTALLLTLGLACSVGVSKSRRKKIGCLNN